MHSDERRTTALVEAARAGDADARDTLVRDHFPLVHNIVGRALDGHADTDDIVQETMVRALDGLTGLRDPSRFRSWLVAIAMNGIRRRWHERRRAPVPGLDRAADLADPAGDFTELTILRLGLSGQRRDVARATRWLDEDDAELLALWWLEAAGELTRAELAEGLGVPPRHAAVRVQRMKERLDTGRAVVRALDALPPCPELTEILTAWDGRPSPLWRKRIARHLRTCAACTSRASGRSGLAPVEGLLVGIGLVPPLAVAASRTDGPAMEYTAHASSQPGASSGHGVSPGPGGGSRPGDPSQPGASPGASGGSWPGDPSQPGMSPGPGASDAAGRWIPLRRAAVAGVAAVAVLGAVALLVPPEPQARVRPDRPVAEPAATTAPATVSPSPVVTTAPAPTTAVPTPRRTPRPTPPPTRGSRSPRSSTGSGRRPVAPRCGPTPASSRRPAATPATWSRAATTDTAAPRESSRTRGSPPPDTTGAPGPRTWRAARPTRRPSSRTGGATRCTSGT